MLRASSLDARLAAVWLAVVVQVGAALLSATVVPQFTVPDEAHHFDMSEAVATTRRMPAPGERNMSTQVLQARVLSRRTSAHTTENAPARPRPPLDTLDRGVALARNNRATQHPPLYYGLSGVLVRAVSSGAGLAWDQHVWLYRALNALLIAPISLLAFTAAQRVGLGRNEQLVAALFPLTVSPYLVRAVPMVNNDALLVLLASAVVFFLVRVVTGDRSWGTVVWLGVLVALAMLTKAYGLILAVLIPLAYGIEWLRHRPREDARLLATRAAASLGAAAVLGGWWWARNIVLYGTVQPAADGRVPADPGFVADIPAWGVAFVEFFVRSFWFFGPAPTQSTNGPVAFVLTLLIVVLSVVAAVTGRRRRAAVWLLIASAGAFVGGAMVWSLQLYVGAGRIGGAQGRYLYPALVALGVLVAAGLTAAPARVRRWAPMAVGVLGVVLLMAQLRAVLVGRYAPGGDWSDRVAALFAWSPWPAWTLVVTAAATAIAAAGLVLFTAAASSRPRATATAATAAGDPADGEPAPGVDGTDVAGPQRATGPRAGGR